MLKRAGAEQVWAATVARTSSSAMLGEYADYGKQEKNEAEVAATA